MYWVSIFEKNIKTLLIIREYLTLQRVNDVTQSDMFFIHFVFKIFVYRPIYTN